MQEKQLQQNTSQLHYTSEHDLFSMSIEIDTGIKRKLVSMSMVSQIIDIY